MRILAIASLGSLALGACANTTGSNRYAMELDELTDACHAKAGVLVPSGPGGSAHPSTDYACKLQDASRIDRS